MKKILYSVIIILITSISCEKDQDVYTSIVDIRSEPIGENCNSGGLKIMTGIDLNYNEVLDENEIQNTEFICNLGLGNIQTGFHKDLVYLADTDGFLSVRIFLANGTGIANKGAKIYSDKTEQPSTIVGEIGFTPGTVVVPIQKDNYWRVELLNPDASVSISWTAVQN